MIWTHYREKRDRHFVKWNCDFFQLSLRRFQVGFSFLFVKSCTCSHQAVNRLWLVHCTNTQYHSQKPYMVRIKMWSLFALYILTLHSSRMSFWTIFHSYALHNAICIVWDHYSIMYVWSPYDHVTGLAGIPFCLREEQYLRYFPNLTSMENRS